MPCAVFVAVTRTPGITAPVGSVTVPEILPVTAAHAPAVEAKAKANTRIGARNFGWKAPGISEEYYE